MRLFCKHEWKEVLRTYEVSGIERCLPLKEVPLSMAHKPSTTTILWECSKCQSLREKTLVGKLLEE